MITRAGIKNKGIKAAKYICSHIRDGVIYTLNFENTSPRTFYRGLLFAGLAAAGVIYGGQCIYKPKESTKFYELSTRKDNKFKDLFENGKVKGYFPIEDGEACSPLNNICVDTKLDEGCIFIDMDKKVAKEFNKECDEVKKKMNSYYMDAEETNLEVLTKQLAKEENDRAKSFFGAVSGYFPIADFKVCSPNDTKNCAKTSIEEGCLSVNLGKNYGEVEQILKPCSELDGTKHTNWVKDKTKKTVDLVGGSVDTLLTETYGGLKDGTKRAAHEVKKEGSNAVDFLTGN